MKPVITQMREPLDDENWKKGMFISGINECHPSHIGCKLCL